MSSCCPVCYKKVDIGLGCHQSTGRGSEDLKKDVDGSMQLRFFKFIQRYLEDGGDEGGVEKETCRKQFPFPLEDFQRIGMISCGECLKLMESFCSLYSQLMTVELYLNWKVQTVKNIMKAAQRVSSRRKNFQDYIIEKVEVDGSRWKSLEEVMDSVSHSRKALITKCSQKLELSVPKLCLEKWKPPMEESVNIESVETSERTIIDSALALSVDSNESSQGRPFPSEDSDEIALVAVAKMEPAHSQNHTVDISESGMIPIPGHVSFSSSQSDDDMWDMHDTEMETGNSLEDQTKANPDPLEINDADNTKHRQNSRKRKCTEKVNLTFAEFEGDIIDDDDFNVSQSSTSSSEEEDKPKPILRSRTVETKLKKPSGTEGRHRLKCPDCAHLFQDVATLLLHRKNSADTSCGASYDPTKSIRVEVIQLSEADNSSKQPLSVVAVADLPQALFICEECDLPVYTLEDLEAHKKLHGTFPCKFCSVTVTFAPDLAIHELRHVKQGKRNNAKSQCYSVYCSRCDTKWSQTGQTSTTVYPPHHLKEHLSLTFKQHKCSICKTTRDGLKFNLGQHFKTHHDLSKSTQQQQIVRCGVAQCDAYFLSTLQLRHHARMHHSLDDVERTGKEKRHKCKDCDRSYYAFQTLREHRLKNHVAPAAQTLLPCPFGNCNSVFESKEDLESHLLRSLFHKPQALNSTVECPTCHIVVDGSHPSHIIDHLKTSHPVDRMTYVCETCGKACKNKTALEIHSLAHSGPESWNFMCSLCSKMCISKQKLWEHMRTHSKDKPFVCQVCGVAYAHRHNLRIHVNGKHGDVVQDVPRKRKKTGDVPSKKGVKRKRSYYNKAN